MTLKDQLQLIVITGLTTGKGAEFVARAILYWMDSELPVNLIEDGFLDDDQDTGEELFADDGKAEAYRLFLLKCGLNKPLEGDLAQTRTTKSVWLDEAINSLQSHGEGVA